MDPLYMKIDTQWTIDFNHKINQYDIKLDKNLLFQFMCLIRDQNNAIN